MLRFLASDDLVNPATPSALPAREFFLSFTDSIRITGTEGPVNDPWTTSAVR